MTVSTVRPWRPALQRERSLPSSVVGPVLLRALRRLASICLSELMGYSTHKIGFVLLVASKLQSSLGRFLRLPSTLAGGIEGGARSRPRDHADTGQARRP